MKKVRNPGRGGSYFKASPDAPAVFVAGTNRKPTEQDKKTLEAAKRKAKPTEEKGGE